MIESLGKWIITICIAVFFTTAVEMLLPDNSLKKYCNFVLGLIVFVVMINPVVEFLNSGQSVADIIAEDSAYVFDESDKDDYKKYRESNIEKTIETFKSNLNKQCAEELKDNFGGKNYKADFSVSYNNENSEFSIDSVSVSVDDGSVERVKEVQIGESLPVGSTDGELGKQGVEIRDYISSKYELDKNKIYIYKASENDAG